MANFRLFSYKGRLPKFFRLVLRTSIVLFTAKLIFKRLKKFIIYALDTKQPILGGFRIRVGYPIFSDFLKKMSFLSYSPKLILKTSIKM